MDARLLIVGLAPGLKGANRTGQPFVGDDAGSLLMRTLARFDAVSTVGSTPVSPRFDGGSPALAFRITNAVRCVPPANKPSPSEIAACLPFLSATLSAMPRLKVILALGRVAHASIVRAIGQPGAKPAFAHGAEHMLGARLILLDSYHCSRYNVHTGRLTPSMFDAVVGRAVELCRG